MSQGAVCVVEYSSPDSWIFISLWQNFIWTFSTAWIKTYTDLDLFRCHGKMHAHGQDGGYRESKLAKEERERERARES